MNLKLYPMRLKRKNRLEELRTDLMDHIHLENNVLFHCINGH